MGRFVNGKPTAKDIDMAKEGLIMAKQEMLSGKYDVIILEEANVAVKYGLILQAGKSLLLQQLLMEKSMLVQMIEIYIV